MSRTKRSKEEGERTAKKHLVFQTPADCQTAIIDRSNPDSKISVDRWGLLFAMANIEYSSIEEMTFEGAGWYKGLKVIACVGLKSD